MRICKVYIKRRNSEISTEGFKGKAPEVLDICGRCDVNGGLN